MFVRLCLQQQGITKYDGDGVARESVKWLSERSNKKPLKNFTFYKYEYIIKIQIFIKYVKIVKKINKKFWVSVV